MAFVAYARGFADAATVVNATARRIVPAKPVVAACDRLDDDIDELSPDVAEMLVDSVLTTDECVCAKKA